MTLSQQPVLMQLPAALLLSCTITSAAELRFTVIPVDEAAEHNAAAVIDVNRDGKLDIVSGQWWYDLAADTRHKVREIEIIRGRYDDYSNLPVDVNGDGRIDIVSANYRSSKLLWIEQPADPNVEWIVHLIAEPGPMETARLADVNGDGRPDVLPNGRDWAAWWEFRSHNGQVAWTRHELPKELAGHGIGYGDVNGDGRIDVIGPRGWAEAPIDPINQQWTWHGEFTLHRDSTVPILVFDVTAMATAIWSGAAPITPASSGWNRRKMTTVGCGKSTSSIPHGRNATRWSWPTSMRTAGRKSSPASASWPMTAMIAANGTRW